jgi:hypothetical protein
MRSPRRLDPAAWDMTGPCGSLSLAASIDPPPHWQQCWGTAECQCTECSASARHWQCQCPPLAVPVVEMCINSTLVQLCRGRLAPSTGSTPVQAFNKPNQTKAFKARRALFQEAYGNHIQHGIDGT